MSKFTTEVRFLCELEAEKTESKGFNSIDTIITTAAPKIFNFDFPIFDENYRLPLEKKILRHYYTREISEETVGLWKLRLEDRLNMIMPYYNKLYNSELLTFNPFYDVNLTRDHTRDNEANQSTTSSGVTQDAQVANTSSTTAESHTDSNLRWDLYSDTPQGGINGITADEDSVANNTYLTNARKISDSGSGNSQGNGQVASTVNDTTNRSESGSSEINSTEDYLEHVTGKMGTTSYSKLLMEFRDTFLNIDKMVIDNLSDLFFGLWA